MDFYRRPKRNIRISPSYLALLPSSGSSSILGSKLVLAKDPLHLAETESPTLS